MNVCLFFLYCAVFFSSLGSKFNVYLHLEFKKVFYDIFVCLCVCIAKTSYFNAGLGSIYTFCAFYEVFFCSVLEYKKWKLNQEKFLLLKKFHSYNRKRIYFFLFIYLFMLAFARVLKRSHLCLVECNDSNSPNQKLIVRHRLRRRIGISFKNRYTPN